MNKKVYELWVKEKDSRDYEDPYDYMIWDCDKDEAVGWYADKTEAHSIFDHLAIGWTLKEIRKEMSQ